MRKKRVYRKYYSADAKYDRVEIGRFINCVMQDGKRSVAERIVYDALDEVAKVTKEDAVTVFERAIENAAPMLEVKSRRVGGANYQVPQEVRPARRFTLAVRWIIGSAKGGKGKPMAAKLAGELVAAKKNEVKIRKPRQIKNILNYNPYSRK